MEEDKARYVNLALGNGQMVRCEIVPNETMRDFAERLKETTGVTIRIDHARGDGQTIDEDTDVSTYLAQLRTDAEDEESAGVEYEYTERIDDEVVDEEHLQISEADDLTGIFCSVSGCGSNKLDCPELAIFQLPPQQQRWLEWVKALGRYDLLTETSNTSEICICSNHFLADQFVDKTRQTLKDTAIPSLFLSPTSHDVDQSSQEATNMEEGELLIKVDASEEVTHPGALCRLCAEPLDSCPLYIFSDDDVKTDQQIHALINSYLPIAVTKSDILPKQICQVCHQRLLLQASFAKLCVEAEEKLTNLARRFVAHNLSSKPKEKKPRKAQNHVCPLCCNGNMEIVSDSDLVLTQDVGECAADASHELYSDDDEAAADSKQTPEECLASVSSLVDNPMDLLYLPEDTKLAFECEICEELFSTALRCEEHCKSHSMEDYHPCVVCGLVFASQQLFENHFFNHKLLKQLNPGKRSSGRTVITCGTCNMQASTRKEFILHVCSKPVVVTSRVEAASSTHSCVQCGLAFTTAERAASHQQQHTAESAQHYACQHCNVTTATKKMLSHHISVVHSGERHGCKECGLTFITADRLSRHMQIHTSGTVKYQCSSCKKLFPTLVDITMHMQTHFTKNEKDKLKLKCFKCNTYFEKREQVERHLEHTHDCIERMPSLIQYQCKICSKRITSSAEVLTHRTVHWRCTDPKLPYLCEYCGEPHASPNALARHRRFLHPDEQPYVCALCEKSTRTLYEARVHRKTHTGHVSSNPPPPPSIFQCDECPSLFSDKTKFINHKKSHKTSRWFMCDICNKAYKTKSRLMDHRAIHTDGKPYTCGSCGKQFAQSSAMYSHARLHTGETPYGCDLCDRMYRTKADRDSHRRSHTGEKPYKCEFCGKRFRTGQVYYQHRMIHTDDRRYRCDLCGKAFKRSHTLVCHRRIHTGEKPNVCDICGKGFRQRTDMRKHKVNMHSVQC